MIVRFFKKKYYLKEILIALFFIISFISFFNIKNERIKNILYVILGVIIILFAGFRDGEKVNDYLVYIELYNHSNYSFDLIVEITYILISKFVYNVFNDTLYLFVIYAILGVLLKLFAIKQLSDLWVLSIVIYLSYFFILHEMTQIRAGVAAGFLLLCIKPIYERNWKHFLLFAILGFLFHYSALIFLPLWILGRKPCKCFLIFSIPLAYVIYFSGINLIEYLPIPGIQEKLDMYQKAQELGVGGFGEINVFNLVFIVKIAIFYVLLWNYELLSERNKYTSILMTVFCISLMSFPIFAVMPVVGFRISELYGIVEILLIPLLYYIFKPQIIARTIVILIALVMLCISIFYNKLIM